jgi:hypothetical protein
VVSQNKIQKLYSIHIYIIYSSLSVDYFLRDRLNLSSDSSSEGKESVDNFSEVHFATFRSKRGSSSGGTKEETGWVDGGVGYMKFYHLIRLKRTKQWSNRATRE